MFLRNLTRSLAGAAIMTTSVFAIPATAATPSPTNIMFVGDSITELSCGDYDTFRDDTLINLDEGGYLFDAVGARNTDSACFGYSDNDHQGWSAHSADQVHAKLPADLATVAAPDIALVALGTNDVRRNQDNASTISEIAQVVGDLRAKNPNMAIILAQIANFENTSTAPLNTQIVALASSLSTSTSPVSTVDFHTGIGAGQMLQDRIHPNATGAAIMGARAAAAIEATGRLAIEPTFGPFYDADGFATQTFRDFTGRNPTGNELGSMLATLAGSEANVDDVVTDLITNVDEYQLRHPITRMYLAYFDRTPDPGGFEFWNDQMMAGQASISGLSYLFSTSEEFVLTYGSLTDAQFINLVYVNVLGRQADQGGYDYWLGLMNAGEIDRPDVMIYFSESVENVTITSRKHVDTVLAYYGMLDRMPTTAELAAAPSSLSATITGIFTSTEYGQRIEP